MRPLRAAVAGALSGKKRSHRDCGAERGGLPRRCGRATIFSFFEFFEIANGIAGRAPAVRDPLSFFNFLEIANEIAGCGAPVFFRALWNS